jgi:ABC-type spermidine/putrescine transport system permease subunit I
MLLPGWALFVLCVGLGFSGLWMAYTHRRVAVVPVLAVLAIAFFTILRLRDPIGLAPQYRRATQDWSYVAALFWSVVLGLTLPIVGIYLGTRKPR